MWIYAQHFAMDDNSYGTGFGPSSPGAINLISGNTRGAIQDTPASEGVEVIDGALFDDAQPTGDKCTTRDSAHVTGKNIGDLLTAAGLSWGWFEGGFDVTIKNPDGSTGCTRTHTSVTGAFPPKSDYIPHHEPFQYYASIATQITRDPPVPRLLEQTTMVARIINMTATIFTMRSRMEICRQ
jgi:phospholipase C